VRSQYRTSEEESGIRLMTEERSKENIDFILSMMGSYFESFKQMSDMNWFVQGK
jgi:hypothetical protein